MLKIQKINCKKMKKLILLLLVFSVSITYVNTTYAQNGEADTEVVDTTAAANNITSADADKPEDEEVNSGFGVLKKYFIDGGWVFMSLVLLCLILGLAFCIERILTLNLLTTNPNKLLKKIDGHLANGDMNAARDAAKSSRGPIASIIYQGLSRSDEGLDMVEKSVVNYGSVLMSKLERNLTWISLFIALAPMLGFMGTVIGMVQAFDSIEKAGDISPSLVAGGIKVALLTTLFGLIAAVILQIFYNYIVSKIDSIVSRMEESSITFVDLLVKNRKK